MLHAMMLENWTGLVWGAIRIAPSAFICSIRAYIYLPAFTYRFVVTFVFSSKYCCHCIVIPYCYQPSTKQIIRFY